MTLNKKLVSRTITLLVLLTIVAGSVVEISAQRRRTRRSRRTATRVVKPVVQYYTVPADTVIRVRMDTELNSRTARVGDRFSSHVVEPVYGGGSGVDVIPVGSRVWGHVTQVARAGRRTPGTITVAFNQVELPNGRTAVINGSLTTLQTDNVNSDNESSVSGRSNRKRDAVFIGGGAATPEKLFWLVLAMNVAKTSQKKRAKGPTALRDHHAVADSRQKGGLRERCNLPRNPTFYVGCRTHSCPAADVKKPNLKD